VHYVVHIFWNQFLMYRTINSEMTKQYVAEKIMTNSIGWNCERDLMIKINNNLLLLNKIIREIWQCVYYYTFHKLTILP